MKALKYWIKQRYNPQLGTYYVAMGQMTKKDAKDCERGCLYGSNHMLDFNTEKEYQNKIKEKK